MDVLNNVANEFDRPNPRQKPSAESTTNNDDGSTLVVLIPLLVILCILIFMCTALLCRSLLRQRKNLRLIRRTCDRLDTSDGVTSSLNGYQLPRIVVTRDSVSVTMNTKDRSSRNGSTPSRTD